MDNEKQTKMPAHRRRLHIAAELVNRDHGLFDVSMASFSHLSIFAVCPAATDRGLIPFDYLVAFELPRMINVPG